MSSPLPLRRLLARERADCAAAAAGLDGLESELELGFWAVDVVLRARRGGGTGGGWPREMLEAGCLRLLGREEAVDWRLLA